MHMYHIIDVDQFVEVTRALVYHSFGGHQTLPNEFTDVLSLLTEEEKNEMNNYISQTESITILKSFCKRQRNSKTNKKRILISEEQYMEYIDALNSRMIGNMLAKLASQGVLETAFDEEINDFVFWASNKNEKN